MKDKVIGTIAIILVSASTALAFLLVIPFIALIIKHGGEAYLNYLNFVGAL